MAGQLRRNTHHTTLDVILNYWTGTLSAHETWSGTVHVGGDVTVPAGVTLTIESGTTVEFAATEDDQESGHSPAKAELIVYGSLQATGATFKSADAGDRWGGIYIVGNGTPSTTSSTISGCLIKDADYGTVIQASDWTLGGADVPDGNTYDNCMYGIYMDGGEPASPANGNTVCQQTVRGGIWGIVLLDADNATLRSNLIENPAAYGIQVDGSSGLLVKNTSVVRESSGGGRGIYAYGQSTGSVSNSIVQGFDDGGIRADATSTVSVDYYLSHDNDLHGHELKNIEQSTARAFFSDPRFVGSGDYRLSSSSPALDLGNPAEADPDPHGRIDIGRYGGTSLAGTATGSALRETYFADDEQQGWWAKASGTSGGWSRNDTSGNYEVTNAQGISRAETTIDASS